MDALYDDLKMFLDWTKTKAELKFNPQPKSFPIIPNCIYWAFMGCNIGSEEGKQYHVDLEKENSTVLVEQMRVIDISRIDKPMRKSGSILSITEKDWKAIDYQIRREYLLTPIPKIQQNNTKNR